MSGNKEAPSNHGLNQAYPKVIVPKPSLVKGTAVTGNPTYGGGPLLTNVDIRPIYLSFKPSGSDWFNDPHLGNLLNTVINPLNGLYSGIMYAGDWHDKLSAEYSVPGQQIGRGTAQYIPKFPVLGVINPPPTPTKAPYWTTTQLGDMIVQCIQSGKIPAPNSNTLYCVWLPPGQLASVQKGLIIQPTWSTTCQDNCGFHDNYFGNGFAFPMTVGTVPDPTCECSPSNVLDAVSLSATHELAEAITDPHPALGWYDAQNGEICDICSGYLFINPADPGLGKLLAASFWSRSTNSCVTS